MKAGLGYLIGLLLVFSNSMAQNNDNNDIYFPDTKYKVDKNEKGLSALLQKTDNKVIIPYIFKDISLLGTPSGVIQEYFVVYDSLKNAGVFSIKENKLLVECNYTEIELVYEDFSQYDNDNSYILCGFWGKKINNENTVSDFYSRNGILLFSTEDNIEFSLIYDTDTIIGETFNYNDYKIKTGLYIFNAKTGVLRSQKK